MIVGAARAFLRVALVTAGTLLIALAVLSLAARLALPLLAAQRGAVETRLGDYLERPVAIGELDLAWQVDGPLLRLGDVSVRETATRGVRFDELLVDVDLVSSLFRRTLVFDELTLVGAELALEYSSGGRFRLSGVESTTAAGRGASGAAAGTRASAGGGLDVIGWLLDAGKVGLLDTRVTIVDVAGERELTVRELNVRAESEGDLHRLRVDLELPPELGGTLEAGIDLVGTSEALGRSDGSAYVRGAGLRLGAWRTLREMTSGVPVALGTALARLDGEAQVELWGRWTDGEMRSARVRADAREIALRPGEDGAGRVPLLDLLSADLAYRDEDPGWTLEADRVELVAGEERSVLEDVTLGRGSRAEGRWHVAAGGERLPFALAAHLASAVLASRDADADADASRVALADALVGLDPGGALLEWRARVAVDGGAPRLSFVGDVDAFSLAPHGRLPGIDALDGRIHLVDGRGTLALGGEGLALSRGTETLGIDAFDAALDVDAGVPGQLRLAGRVALERDSLDADADVGLTLSSGRSPHVDLRARYAVGDLADLPPWLPIAGASPALAGWFERAFAGGQAENGELVWSGQLAEFPYDAPTTAGGDATAGVFRGGVDIVDGSLAFLPDWPAARIRRGRVELDGMSLVGTSTDVGLGDVEASEVRVVVADLRRPRLALTGSGRSDLQSLVRFGREGPLKGILGEVLAETTGTGRAGMDIALEVPLARGAGGPFEVAGSLFLDGNDVAFGRADITLARARGSVGFDERGVRIGNLRATLFGRPVTLDGATSGRGEEAVTELRLAGALEAADVLAHYGIPLDRFVGGVSRWDVTLSAPHSAALVRRDGVRLLAESDLVGTELKLPAPLAKGSARAIPLSLSSAFRPESERILWRIEHGSRLRAAIETDADGLRSLGARLGEGAVDAPAAPGIRLDGSVPRLALDGWAEALATLIEDLPDSVDGPTPILPIRAALSIDALVAGTRSLGPATLRMTTDAQYLNAVVDNEHLAGSVRYPREHWRRERAALVRVAHVDKHVVDALGSAPEPATAPAALDPREFPAIDAHVSRLEWDALVLREVTLRARPNPRGLTLEAFTEMAGETTFAARGSWLLGDAAETSPSRPGRHRSTLDLALTGENLGAGLVASGYPGLLAEGGGEVRATLGWRGPLYLPELERTEGSLSIDVVRGRILPLELGSARLVGLFALQALPRRLLLDFSDVTADGLSFERVAGDVSLAGGVADVSLVQLTGPVGVVDISGTSDLVRREYDQRITVLPRVSAALPIIGAIAGGASGGIGALLAGGVLKAMGLDFDRIGLRRYSLRGSWDDPVIAPLETSRRDRTAEP